MDKNRILQRLIMQPITGMRSLDLLRVLARNDFRISPGRTPVLAFLAAASIYNSVYSRYENRLNMPKVAGTRVSSAPIFILGHFRSGTTYLQNLMSFDENLCTPNYFQAMFPHVYLYCQRVGGRVMNSLLPPTRPMDNVALSAHLPHEDEFALAALSLTSPYLRFLFPVTGDKPHSSLDPLELPSRDLERFKHAMDLFIRKLTFARARRVLLKSPPHLARVRVILELQPRARFIFLARNPYDVYLSTVHLWKNTLSRFHLQNPPDSLVEQTIFSWYGQMHSLFERDRGMIPPGQLTEIRYEDLEREPLAVLARIYDELDLPGFEGLEKGAAKYLEGIAGYRKNRFILCGEDRDKVAREWEDWFRRYGYPL